MPGADHHTVLASWLKDSMQPALEGEEVPFLAAGTFLAELESMIAKRSANNAAVFSINAMIPANSLASQAACPPQELVPSLAKVVRWILGPSGIILRVGPGLLVCIHIAHRPVDPELVERSIRRIFNMPGETEGILKDSFCFDPAAVESKQALIRFLSSL
jgi:hypothetical protein